MKGPRGARCPSEQRMFFVVTWAGRAKSFEVFHFGQSRASLEVTFYPSGRFQLSDAINPTKGFYAISATH